MPYEASANLNNAKLALAMLRRGWEIDIISAFDEGFTYNRDWVAPWNAPDGQINAADLLIAAQLVLGSRIAGPLQLAHGDMNIDGIIDMADLVLIQQLVLP